MASGKWNGEMSYEQIGRDEAAGVPPLGVMRPGMEKRRSSWWGWGGGPTEERDKVE